MKHCDVAVGRHEKAAGMMAMAPGDVIETAVVAVCKHLAEALDSELAPVLVQKTAVAAYTADELVAELTA